MALSDLRNYHQSLTYGATPSQQQKHNTQGNGMQRVSIDMSFLYGIIKISGGAPNVA